LKKLIEVFLFFLKMKTISFSALILGSTLVTGQQYWTGFIPSDEDEAMLRRSSGQQRLIGRSMHHVAGGHIPTTLNWAAQGKMNPVKSQGQCGSCWAFAAADALSSRDAVKNGRLHDLSEKHFLDCTYESRSGKDGCNGGHSFDAWINVAREGVAGQNNYRNYNAADEWCPGRWFDSFGYKRVSHAGSSLTDGTVHKYYNDRTALQQDIAKYGPCVMSIGVSTPNPNKPGETMVHPDFNKLGSNVWQCDKYNVPTDHAVTVVGWGIKNGERYWHIKNSWGTGWGDKGYGRISMDRCKMGSNTGLFFSCPEVRKANVPVPTAAGCHILAPSGCPKNPGSLHGVTNWGRDSWGERNRGSGKNEDVCLINRKRDWNSWCGVSDIQMHFVGVPIPKPPTSAGCYILGPSGCPKNPGAFSRSNHWYRDHHDSKNNQHTCLERRVRDWNSWCGVSNVEMHFVALPVPSAPRNPGCYVLGPSGCPKNPRSLHKANDWGRDSWGESHRGSGRDRNVCLNNRARDWNNWCGVSNFKMHFVPVTCSLEHDTNAEYGIALSITFKPSSTATQCKAQCMADPNCVAFVSYPSWDGSHCKGATKAEIQKVTSKISSRRGRDKGFTSGQCTNSGSSGRRRDLPKRFGNDSELDTIPEDEGAFDTDEFETEFEEDAEPTTDFETEEVDGASESDDLDEPEEEEPEFFGAFDDLAEPEDAEFGYDLPEDAEFGEPEEFEFGEPLP